MKKAGYFMLAFLLFCIPCGWCNTVLPADVPLYPGFRWNEPRNVSEEGSPSIIVESKHQKGIKASAVEDFYMKGLAGNGWKVLGPAGGSSSWTISGTKGGRACRVYFTMNRDYATDSTADPNGIRLRIVYWKECPQTLKH